MFRDRRTFWSDMTDEVGDLRVRVAAEAQRLRTLRLALDEWSARVGVAADVREALVLAGYEAMANVVLHAYGPEGGMLELHASYLPDAGEVHVTVADEGQWRTPEDQGLLHGRGLPIMRAMAANTTIDTAQGGTTVHMRWSCQPQDRDIGYGELAREPGNA